MWEFALTGDCLSLVLHPWLWWIHRYTCPAASARHCFPGEIHCLWLFWAFCSLFHRGPGGVLWGVAMMPVPHWASHCLLSLILDSMACCMSLLTSFRTNGSLSTRTERYTHLWVPKSLAIRLVLYPFSRKILAVSPLAPMTWPAPGSYPDYGASYVFHFWGKGLDCKQNTWALWERIKSII